MYTELQKQKLAEKIEVALKTGINTGSLAVQIVDNQLGDIIAEYNKLVRQCNAQSKELERVRDESYQKGYSDGRNGLYNADLLRKIEGNNKKPQNGTVN